LDRKTAGVKSHAPRGRKQPLSIKNIVMKETGENTPKRLELELKMRQKPCYTQDHHGSGGVLRVDNWCFESDTKISSLIANTYDTRCKEVSHTRWGPKEKGNNSLNVNCMPACSQPEGA